MQRMCLLVFLFVLCATQSHGCRCKEDYNGTCKKSSSECLSGEVLVKYSVFDDFPHSLYSLCDDCSPNSSCCIPVETFGWKEDDIKPPELPPDPAIWPCDLFGGTCRVAECLCDEVELRFRIFKTDQEENLRHFDQDPCSVKNKTCCVKQCPLSQANFKRIGCYADKKTKNTPRPLANMVFTDRDTSSQVFSGERIQWKDWKSYSECLICRCALYSYSRYKYFGLQHYGECWAGNDKSYERDGKSRRCINQNYKQCLKSEDPWCIGKGFANFVYTWEAN